MSTIRTLVTGITVVAAGAGAAAALAATGTASAGTATASARTFSLTAHPGQESTIDLGASGFSAGDEDLGVSTLTRNGSHAGRMVVDCTTVRVGKTADQLCEFVLHLRRGQITASGTVRSDQNGPGTFVLPILGGSGRYQGAAGQLAVAASSGRTIPLTVTLR